MDVPPIHVSFWSQNRQWQNDDEKTLLHTPITIADRTNRELLSRTTVLKLDMEAVQNYLRNRNLFEASSDLYPGVGPDLSSGDYFPTNTAPLKKLISMDYSISPGLKPNVP